MEKLLNRWRLHKGQSFWFAAVLLLLVLGVQLVHVSRVTSSTWDEAHHLFDGYVVWTQEDYGLNPEVPPLVKLTAALPLLHAQLAVPKPQGRSIPDEAFKSGREFVFGNGGDRVLFPARMACAVFTLGLGMLLCLAGREMFGATAGLIALAFFVFDPNFLAHGALVTTDVGSAFFLFAGIYAWYRYCKSPGWERLTWTGIVAGLALAAKFTGIFIFPMFVLLAVAEAWRLRSGRALGRLLVACVAVSALSLVVLWSFYGFRYKARSPGKELNPAFADYMKQVPRAADARHLALLAHWHALPEAYLWGLANTKVTENEDTSYFFGHVYRHGNWMYFPAAFLIKSTLPFLLLLALLIGALTFGRWRAGRELVFLAVPVIVYLVVVMRSDMNIGLRHILPIYGFLYVLAAGAVSYLARRDKRWLAVVAVLLVWQIATSLHAAPAYMAYANEAWGGPSQVHKYLSDANSDWGQQLKATKRYLDRRGIKNCWFAYFPDGAIEPADYGIPCKRLPTTDTLWWLHLPMDVPPAIDGPVLISDSDLEGIEFGQGALNPYEGFRRLRPAAVMQDGLFVYDGHFEVRLASGLVHAQKAQDLLKARQTDAAEVEAEQAVALAPDAVTAQVAMGDVLVEQKRGQEALGHYRAALSAAKTIEPELQENWLVPLQNKINALVRP